ncbi:hypothetical protein TRAPUB_12081 [Trametes pubescens]|uniref:Uncharacterized protein n=1 Tax=Trametes pubescens TaxID=154538 RepID=A0A1M2VV31_TRAPU|nr:hypothetical protein TRAPUB_12081 [Trametes pubescens]
MDALSARTVGVDERVQGVEEDRSDVAENGSREDLANLERVLFEDNAEKPRGLATVVVELALFVTRALRRLCAS